MIFTASQIREAESVADAKDMIKHNISENDQWLIRGLLAIFDRQTADEQSIESTKHHNNIGFNGLDANILSSFAKQVIRWNNAGDNRQFNSPLSPKQIKILRRKMVKYAGQLALIARQPQNVAI